LSGLFDVNNAVQLGAILKTDLFAVLETTSIIVFDAKTGLRYADETLPKKLMTPQRLFLKQFKPPPKNRTNLVRAILLRLVFWRFATPILNI
jgi:hypothetical protein